MNSSTFESKIRPFNINKSAISEKIRKVMSYLETPLEERSNYQTYQISLYLEEYPFFARFGSSGILSELMKHLKIEYKPLGTVLIPWTTNSSNFFLILAGRVGEYRKEEKGFEPVREFSSGSCFGEEGILGELQKVEFRTVEACQLMVLEKEVFEVVINNMQKEKYEEQYSFFKSIPGIESLGEETLAHLAKVALTKKFSPNTIVAKQGDRPRGFFIIHSGSAKLLRNVNYQNNEENFTHIIEIDEIESGGLFCEYSFVNQEPLDYSVLCSMPLITYFLDRDDFRGQNKKFLQEIKKISSKIPSDSELFENFQQKLNWKKFKSKFLNSLEAKKKKLSLFPKNENFKLPQIKRGRNFSV
jgi:CRP-like cAMP-binding protein